MRIPFPAPATPAAKAFELKAPAMSRERALRLAALGLILALAAALRLVNLQALGLVNHYYSAAVTSMLQSWHNFFFVAAEPGGSVSVDKPPVGLWLQAISAAIFGVNTLGVLLPEIVAGIASVAVVYHLVGRKFGTAAGLLAALALALTPVAVATDRNNTMDSTLILTLLLAAWAFIRATETRRLRDLLLGAVLVGVGFNIKMLAAYLPLPAFFALYLLGSAESLLRRIGKLALATVVLLAVSLSWALAVDLTPANQRPYVGGSGDNSELSLIVGYNGLSRLLGTGRGQPAGPALPPGANRAMPQPPAGALPRPGQDGDGAFPPDGTRPDGARPQGGPGGGGGGAFNTGQPGVLRLFVTPLSKEASWLLPFGLFGAVLLGFGYGLPRLQRGVASWSIGPEHQALVLWGGWLVAAGAFFSVAGFFHEYYLSILAPPIAALVGIGAVVLWRLREHHAWRALGSLLAAAIATLALQIATAWAYVSDLWWLPFALALLVLGAAAMAAARKPHALLSKAGFLCAVAALLVTPGVWSGLTALYSSGNQSLPAAYAGAGQSTGPANGGGLQINQALLDYLQANTQGMRYLMAVPSSMQGADYVLATGRPVLYLGGFNGQDQVETADSLAQLVASGQLRYIYWGAGGGFGPPQGGSGVTSWVTANCQAVTGFETETRNAGAPDGTTAGPDAWNGNADGFGGAQIQVALYDCQS